MLKFSYMRDATGVVWDLGGVFFTDGIQEKNWVGMLRRSPPPPGSRDDVIQNWQSMLTGEHPWEGAAFLSNGHSEISAMVNAKDVTAGKTKVGYTMTLNLEGTQAVTKMKSEFTALERGLKIFE